MIRSTSAEAILKRVHRRLAALKVAGQSMSDRSLSLAATGSADTLRSIRRNVAKGSQRGISTETIEKLAGPLKTTGEWLLSGNGAESADAGHIDSEHFLADDEDPGVRKVRVVGYVGAGSMAHYYAVSDEDFEEVPAPSGAGDQSVAVEIRGKSFGPLMDHWLVFYDAVRSPVTPDLFGKICVVGLSNDQILVKQIVRERDGSFSLLSNSNEAPIRNAQIEWAALVTDMRPR